MSFFAYESPYRTHNFIDLTPLEFVLPFVVLATLIILIVTLKDTLRSNPVLDRNIRYIAGTLFIVLYSSHYLLRFSIYGFDTLILPFQLCSISMFFAIILLFKENRTIFTFVLYAGVLGGLVSLFTPIIGYDSQYYRYYQFYGAHILLILTPLYFLIVKSYYPTKKETVYAFLMLQVLAVCMGVFNYYLGTDFMFIFVDPSKIDKFPVIQHFGGIPYYLIVVEIVGIILHILLYQATQYIYRMHLRNNLMYYKKA